MTAASPTRSTHLWSTLAPPVADGAARLDRESLTAAYGEHAGAVYGLAYRMLGDRLAAEDVTHDAFLKLWTGAAQFDPARGPLLGLLLTIARHKAIDGMRRVSRRQRSEGSYCLGEPSADEGPEQVVLRAQDARELRSALLLLPYEQRRVIEMAYFADMTCRQIADDTSVSVGTVKSRMRLGMRKLAVALRGRRRAPSGEAVSDGGTRYPHHRL